MTRGPGATNASIGVHTAYQDSTPIILFIGQVGSDMVEREAFQEVDYRRMFGADEQVDRADRPRGPHSRVHRARLPGRDLAGARGRSCWRCPRTCRPRKATSPTRRCHQPVQAAPSDTQIATLQGMLGQAQRPFVILGGTGWTSAACDSGAPLGRGQRAADRLRVPLPGPVRQPPSELRRRRRHRHQSEARRSACASPTS